MRILALATCLIVGAIAANAEPPPQAAVAAAPAITVADARTALPAVMVTQVDTTAAAASSTAVVDTPRVVTAEKSSGHGMGFWIVIAAAVLVLAFALYRYFTRGKRESETRVSSGQDVPDRTRPPG